MLKWLKVALTVIAENLDTYLWKREYRKVMVSLIENCEPTDLNDLSPIDELVEKGYNRFYGNAIPEDAAYYIQGVW